MIKIVFKNGTLENMDDMTMEYIEYILGSREYRLIDILIDLESKKIFKVLSEINEKNLIMVRDIKKGGTVLLLYNHGENNVIYLNKKEYNYKDIIYNNCFI